MVTTTQFSIEQALLAARETRSLDIGTSILDCIPRLFRKHFGQSEALIVADTNTYAAAGRTILNAFRAENSSVREPFIFDEDPFYADYRFVERLEDLLRQHHAIPIAVGSGTINDIVKLAAHRVGRPYLCVATAASMDGYTAYGASITFQGSKQTFDCPAPLAVVADLSVIASAPAEMNAWGYADLLAKVTAGADWIVADMLAIDAIQPIPWKIVQSGLRDAIASPSLVRKGDRIALRKLVEGLMLGGFAMQAMQSSRPASGAEHQFSHLWDMQHHTHCGRSPSHGQKVGIGTLAVTALYEKLLAQTEFPVDPLVASSNWPSRDSWLDSAKKLFEHPELRAVALREIDAKYVDRISLHDELEVLRGRWSELRHRLKLQLFSLDAIRSMLAEVESPTEPEQIGITRERMQQSFRMALFIRRRFTVLDLVARMGLLDEYVADIFTLKEARPSSNHD